MYIITACIIFFIELSRLIKKHKLNDAEEVAFDSKIDRTDLIAKHIAHHWRILAQNLGFSKSKISAITGNNDMEKGERMLDDWIKNDAMATYSRFIEVCLEVDQKLAEKLCQKLHLQGIYIYGIMYNSTCTIECLC